MGAACAHAGLFEAPTAGRPRRLERGRALQTGGRGIVDEVHTAIRPPLVGDIASTHQRHTWTKAHMD